MQPTFTGTSLITADVLGLAGFYADLLSADIDGDEVFAVVSCAGAMLSMFSISGMEAMVPGVMRGSGAGGFTLEFEIDDPDARHERIKDTVTVVKPPTTQPWGRRSFWLRDPDGNLVNLYQRLAPVAP